MRGPFPSGRIRRYLVEGTLQLEDQVSRDKQEWQPVARVPEVVPLQFRRGDREAAEGRREESRRERRQALGSIAFGLVLFALAVGVSLWLGEPGPRVLADCSAPPAPGVVWQNCRLDGLLAEDADLRGADLSNASLVSAGLHAAHLEGADLRYADLSGADLTGARLAGARLTGTDLRGADLSGADLQEADLRFADLREAYLQGTRLQGARLGGALWLDGHHCPRGAVGGCP